MRLHEQITKVKPINNNCNYSDRDHVCLNNIDIILFNNAQFKSTLIVWLCMCFLLTQLVFCDNNSKLFL